MYPDLPKKIKEINANGIKFLGYVNPYLVNDGELYKEEMCIRDRDILQYQVRLMKTIM